MDNAIWYKSSTLEIPSNIELAFIPPYTPEMNPIEQVWKEIRKRGFKNKDFQTLEAVIDKLQEVIQGLEKSVLKIIGISMFPVAIPLTLLSQLLYP